MPLSLKSPPRISVQEFAAVLQRGTGQGPSPAAPLAHDLYGIILEYGLDPAIALGFFACDSQLGHAPVCREYDTRSWGVAHTAYDMRRVLDVIHTPAGDVVRYASWHEGLRDWCERLLQRYVDRWGLDTVEKVVTRYAPSEDGRLEQRYVQHIHQLLSRWQAEDPARP
jgi:hypothetical protein